MFQADSSTGSGCTMTGKRCFLFLQGVCSPFFSGLADKLKAKGHHIHKINFTVGDCAYWGKRPAWNYRGSLEDLGQFLSHNYREFCITDQILFGDCRPVHRPAVIQGKENNVRTHVFEEGYFRPYWLTLERGGVNGHSQLPRDPAWYREVGSALANYGDGKSFRSTFSVRALHDVGYHLAGFWNPFIFPQYHTHAPVIAPVEYLGYLRRLPLLRIHRIRDNKLIKNLLNSKTPFYLLPLQLNGDAQILHHSPFKNMKEVIELVMESFSRHAPKDAKLVIKNHPLDIGLVNYAEIIRHLSDRFDLSGRLEYMETGDLETMAAHAKGTITVNSTVGAVSLGSNCPTIALSDPIYNLPGLTYQGCLDTFWKEATMPDLELFRQFRNTIIHCTQINGGFYSKQGIDLATENCLPLLEREQSPLEELL